MKNKKKKIVKKTLVVIGGVIAVAILAASLFVYNNLYYYKAPMKAVIKAGFQEKQAKLPDGSILNYGEGGEGIPLLLIHGQGVAWEDYMEVIPNLSEHYHIYAVDCYGHGQSDKNKSKYSANVIGSDLEWFIENIIGEPCVVSGHSSGGLLAAWLSANSSDNIIGAVLEDPPLFSSEAERTESTFAWIDTFEPAHKYLDQSITNDYSLYYLENCIWLTYFGDAGNGIIKYANDYRYEHPDEPIKFFYLPPSMTRIFLFLDDYDPNFGNAFYDYSWMEDFDHASTLEKIECPTVLIHTNYQYDENGILLAAMDDKDAKKASQLIRDCELINIDSGHDSHAEKPKEFIKVMINFIDKIN